MKTYSRQHFTIFALLLSFSVYADNTEEVEVTGKKTETATETLSGFEVETIEAEKFFKTAADVNDIIAFSPGVIIRETGGLGSQFELAINGLSGEQIRYFFDGIPIQDVGFSLGLNNFPASQIEGVEIFKGVVPIRLSADALGGAINIITPSLDEERYSASYSIGSFNTHRLSLFGQNANESGFFWRFNGYFNYSDNDYKMDRIAVTDELGNISGKGTYKRFHDVYRSSMVNLKSGVIHQDYADELSFNIAASKGYDEVQHPTLSITPVFGAIYQEDKTTLLSSTYRKRFDNLDITAYGLIGQTEITTHDTKNRKYDWNGNFTTRNDVTSGEFRGKTVLTIKDKFNRANISASYDLTPTQTSIINISSDSIERSGKDAIKTTEFTPFDKPNKLQKHVFGFAHDSSFFNDRIGTSAFIKRYLYNADVDVIVSTIAGNVKRQEDNTLTATGYGLTSRYDLAESLTLKASFERSFRLPRADEAVGDGLYTLSNPDLKEEESRNINLGLVFTHSNRDTNLTLDSNLFFRDSKNFIHRRPVGVITSRFVNEDNVNVTGIEIALSTSWESKLFIDFNATYQDFISKTRFDIDGDKNENFNERIPNEPYLFANLLAKYIFDLANGSEFSASWKTFYVHEYFLNWKNLGRTGSKFIIDQQLSHDIDLTYTFPNEAFSVNLTLQNMFDEELFDRFDIQKPGRAYYLTLQYAL